MRRNLTNTRTLLAATLAAVVGVAFAAPAAAKSRVASKIERYTKKPRAIRLERRLDHAWTELERAGRKLEGYWDHRSEQELAEGRARLGFARWHIWNEAFRAARRNLDRVATLTANVSQRARATRRTASEARTLMGSLKSELPAVRRRVNRTGSSGALADLGRAESAYREARRHENRSAWQAARDDARRARRHLNDADRTANAILAQRKVGKRRFDKALSSLDQTLDQARRVVRRARRHGDRMAARTLARAEQQRTEATHLARRHDFPAATRMAKRAERTADTASDHGRTTARRSGRHGHGRRVASAR